MPSAAKQTRLVFVYGTLKRGGSNHAFLADQTYLGEAALRPGFSLYSLGDYPGLVSEPENTKNVTGELWAVDASTLANLDALEGINEGLYARVPAPLARWSPDLDNQAAAAAEMYLYLHSVTGRQRLGTSWPVT
ncbi:MAG: gamma-glutamylcyclotransferase [Verrucomicrobia bacterium]|nr:gamma-glutamylcyclotransferase [Verrucomicrobiota bacterium]